MHTLERGVHSACLPSGVLRWTGRHLPGCMLGEPSVFCMSSPPLPQPEIPLLFPCSPPCPLQGTVGEGSGVEPISKITSIPASCPGALPSSPHWPSSPPPLLMSHPFSAMGPQSGVTPGGPCGQASAPLLGSCLVPSSFLSPTCQTTLRCCGTLYKGLPEVCGTRN